MCAQTFSRHTFTHACTRTHRKYDEGERFDLRSPYADDGWVDPEETDAFAGTVKQCCTKKSFTMHQCNKEVACATLHGSAVRADMPSMLMAHLQAQGKSSSYLGQWLPII